MASLRSAWNNIISYAWRHPFARDDRIGTYGRILRWQVRSRLARGPLVMPWVNDAKLRLRHGQSGGTGNLYYGLFEFADMAFFVHFLREADVFADIGANVGSYTVLAGQVTGAKVHAFEPVAETLAALEANVALNGIADRVTIHPVALGRGKGVACFTATKDATNRFATEDDGATIEVQVDTADACLCGLGVVAMKVDVEGAEDLVFSGAAKLLAEPQLVAIEVETLRPGVREAMEGAGFTEYWYDPRTRTISGTPNGLGQNNHLFLRDVEFVADRVRTAEPVRFGRLQV